MGVTWGTQRAEGGGGATRARARAALALTFLLTAVGVGARGEELAGAIVVRPVSYGVVMNVVRSRGRCHVHVYVSRGDQPVARATITFDGRHASLTQGHAIYAIPDDVASSWWAELNERRSGRLESDEVQMLGVGLAARIERDYDAAGKLTAIRMFGLEEWNNSFHEYFSLGLTRTLGKE